MRSARAQVRGDPEGHRQPGQITLRVVGAYALFYLLFFAPVLFAQRLLAYGDSWTMSVPAFFAPKHLWTDTLCCGFPCGADPLMQTWNPLFHALSFAPIGWNIYMLLAYVVGSSAMFAFVRELTGSRPAAAIAGLVLMINGFMITNIVHEFILHVVAYEPVVLLALHKLARAGMDKPADPLSNENEKQALAAPDAVEKPSAGWIVVGSVAVGLAGLSGSPQMFVHLLMLCGAYALFLTLSQRPFRWQFLMQALSVFTIGGALAAVQILPAYELGSTNWRFNMSYDEHVSYSIEPFKLIGLLFPALLGISQGSLYGLPYFGPGLIQQSSIYFGIFTLLLAMLGMRWQDRKQRYFWIMAAAVSLLLSLGAATPLSKLFYLLPVYNKFRAQGRHMCEFGLEIAVLAAFGLAQMLSGRSYKTPWTARIVTASGGLFVGLLFLLPMLVDLFKPIVLKNFGVAISSLPWQNPAIGIPTLFFGAAAGLILSWPKIQNARLKIALAVALVAIDLSSYAWFAPWRYECAAAADLVPPPHATQYAVTLGAGHQRYFPLRASDGTRAELPVNFSRMWNLPCATGYEGLAAARLRSLLGLAEGGFPMPQTIWRNDSDQSFDLLSVRYLSMPAHSAQHPQWYDYAQQSRWKLAQTVDDALFLESTRALPRAWAVNEVVHDTAEAALKAIKTSRRSNGKYFDVHYTAFLEPPFPLEAQPVQPDVPLGSPDAAPLPTAKVPSGGLILPVDGSARVEVAEAGDWKTVVAVTTKKKAFIVLSQIYYRGCKALLDGIEVPLVPCDYAIVGVFVPPGTHSVTFTYDPESFRIGAGITVGALLIVLALAARQLMITLRAPRD